MSTPLLWFGVFGGWAAASAQVLIGWWAVEVGCPGTDRAILVVTSAVTVVLAVGALAAAMWGNRRLRRTSDRDDRTRQEASGWLDAVVGWVAGRVGSAKGRPGDRRGGRHLPAWELVGGAESHRFLAVTGIYFSALALGILLFSLPHVLLQQPCV